MSYQCLIISLFPSGQLVGTPLNQRTCRIFVHLYSIWSAYNTFRLFRVLISPTAQFILCSMTQEHKLTYGWYYTGCTFIKQKNILYDITPDTGICNQQFIFVAFCSLKMVENLKNNIGCHFWVLLWLISLNSIQQSGIFKDDAGYFER